MYFRLTYTATPVREQLGDSFLNGGKPLHIGQGAAADVQLPESENYEPEVYATILQQEDDKGWYVVKRTDCHHVSVNGEEVAVAQRLNSGDQLAFGDGTQQAALRFDIVDDGDYDAAAGIVYRKHDSNKSYRAVSLLLAVAALALAAYGILSSRQRDLRQADLRQYASAVYHITVDSLYLLCADSIVEAIELDNAAAGTAFLATDGSDSLFVTARHCIEPWLNDDEWNGLPGRESMSPEVWLATTAETENRLTGNDRYVLRAHCIISKGFEHYDYYSTDFCMNKSRDMVMRLGTLEEPLYWRTIVPIAHRRDMELGDFAYVKATGLPQEGHRQLLPLANWEETKKYALAANGDIAVVGYPLNDNDADNATVVYGNHAGLALPDSLTAPDGCLQLSAPINRGNSGGPVVALIGSDIKVVGIVSKADVRADQGMFWAVPAAEVLAMRRQGDKAEEDSVTYRR